VPAPERTSGCKTRVVPGVEAVLLIIAGVAAGLIGSVAGLASLISYPALFAAGLPPISANVTNTVALVFSGVGSTLASRPELRQQRSRVPRLAVAGVAGGLVGAAFLLLTPGRAFEHIVPWLIGLASVAILVPRRAFASRLLEQDADSSGLAFGAFVIAVYGGYFGAAAGVVLLALLLLATGDTLPRSNALKNVVLCAANVVAATLFAVFSDVRWLAVLPLSVGFFVGGTLGPAFVRRAPSRGLRVGIAVAGLAVAVRLGWQAYG
jgi:uncharacterized membrane protein YfcA